MLNLKKKSMPVFTLFGCVSHVEWNGDLTFPKVFCYNFVDPLPPPPLPPHLLQVREHTKFWTFLRSIVSFVENVRDYYSFCSHILGENPPGCDGYFKNKFGNITSPGYPSPYPDEAACSYIIGVQSLSIIAITFNDVQFESGLDSLYYGVGRIVDIEQYEGKLTGRDIPEAIEVQTDSGMWFYLMTDEGVGYRGFSLSWKIQGWYTNRPTW